VGSKGLALTRARKRASFRIQASCRAPFIDHVGVRPGRTPCIISRMNTDDPRGDFTEREMRLIFERAGEADARSDGERRYSLAELQAIASQVGLDAGDVTRAAAAVRGTSPGNIVLGAPVRFRSSRLLGHELSEDEILRIVSAMRDTTGIHGVLTAVPGGMEWRARSSMGAVIIDFGRSVNGTRVDVLVARDDQAAVTVIGTVISGIILGLAAGIGAASIVPVWGALGIGIVAAAGSAWLGTRVLWSRMARRWSAEANVLAETATHL
jgi:hypothetical protein